MMASRTLQAACAWKVGNGASIRAGNQAWVYGQVPTFRDNVPLRCAATTYVNDLILPHQQGWNSRRIND